MNVKMKKLLDFKDAWRLCKESLKDKNRLLTSLFYDFITLAGIFGLIFSFMTYLQQRNFSIMDGRTVTQIQNFLLTPGAETESLALLNQIQGLLYIFVFGSLLVIFLVVLIFAYTRARLWSRMLGKSFAKKRFWKWMPYSVLMAIVLFVLYVAVLLLRIIVFRWFPNQVAVPVIILKELFTQGFLVLLLYVFFASSLRFRESYKIWASIGDGFALIKSKFGLLWKIILIKLLVLSGLLSLVTYGLFRIFGGNSTIFYIVQPLLYFVLLAWVRVYFYKAVSDE